MLIAEAVNGGRRTGMAEVGSTTKSFEAIGKPMTLGRVAVDYPLSQTSTRDQEAVQCSVCFKAGYLCLPPAQERAP